MAGSFSADLSRFVNRANSNVNRLVKDVILQIGKEIVDNSIVGDANYWTHPAPPGYVGGRFRANWQHGIGTMPTSKFDTTANVSYQRIQGTMPNQAGGKIHWLVNNVPYSIAIENGTASRRSPPQGVVGRTMLRVSSIVATVAANIR